jgi:hypothetical protein
MNSDVNPNPAQSPGVSFQPLHSGLGFHPFPDGLPYSPTSNSRRAQPRSNAEAHAPYTIQSTRAHQKQEKKEALQSAWTPPLLRQTPPKKTKKSPNHHSVLTQKEHPESLGYSYLITRTLSYVLDLTIHTFLVSTVVALTLWFNDIDIRILTHSGMFPIIAIFFMAFNWLLVMIQELVFRSSLGKSVFHLVIPASRTKIFLRALLFIPSATLGIPLILGLFNRKRRCLHDLPFDTQPTRITKL